MKQLVLDPTSGKLSLASVSLPAAAPGTAVVRVSHSVVSTGTELSKVNLAAQPLWEKARSRPDQVAKVLESVRTEGVAATIQKVRTRLATPQGLGYSLSGVIEQCGEGCSGLSVGMPVACGGATAAHAEAVAVPQNLIVPVPPGVSGAEAAFATVASIAMHGVRTGGVVLGDRVLVIGLGLIGQLAVRLCVAAGAHVFGVDVRRDRADLALGSGAEAVDDSLDRSTADAARAWSRGRGADVVLITAGGADPGPLALAGEAARDRARVIVVGAVDLDVPREPFYHKELTLVVSRSYGPGRYDPDFEEKGMAYPVGFVPWTERRNMEEFLDLLACGRLSLDGLRGVCLPFDRAPEGYELLSGESGPAPISVIFEYPGAEGRRETAASQAVTPAPPRNPAPTTFPPRALHVSFVGLGNFASATLLPAVTSFAGASLARVVTATPLKAEAIRQRAGFGAAGTSAPDVWQDASSGIVFIATRHDSHAALATEALRAGKAVFVEKPLALTEGELSRVAEALHEAGGRLTIGFNRRFAPATRWLLDGIGADRSGLRFLCRVNAGPLPNDHWLLDRVAGGGRLLGEACHFIDLATFFCGAEPTSIAARALDLAQRVGGPQDFSIDIEFANGATAAIEYLSGGDPSLAKERIEVHHRGTSGVIDDFRRASLHRGGKAREKKWPARDKGHRALVHAFLEAVRDGGPTPIPERESLRSTALTLAAARAIREARVIRVETP